jgi:MFS family permease
MLVLLAINTINFADRQVLGAVGEAVRREWSLGDTGLGTLGTAFTVLYALLGVPFGRLADTTSRTRLLAVGVFVWSGLTAVSGFAQNYWQLFAARLGVGVGEATCAPAATSLIGDFVPPAARAWALSLFMLGLPIGLALGYLIGGVVGQQWGWRAAFYVAAAPGLLCAFAVLRIREPPRGSAEAASSLRAAAPAAPFRSVLSIRTFWWLVAAGVLHTFNMTTLGVFLSSFLIRVHGVSLARAGVLSMAVYGLSGIAGLLVGGALVDRAFKRTIRGRLIVGMAAMVVSGLFIALALGRPPGALASCAILMAVGCGAGYAFYSSVYTTIHDCVEPALRGTAMSLFFMAVYVLGAALGPMATGALSDALSRRAAAAAGVIIHEPRLLEPFRGEGLHTAFTIVPCFAILAGVLLWAASRTIKSDARTQRP